MFVPPYKALLGALGITAEQLDKQAEVTVSAKSLKLLIKAAVFGSEVDETGYLSANPDVRDALAKRTIAEADLAAKPAAPRCTAPTASAPIR